VERTESDDDSGQPPGSGGDSLEPLENETSGDSQDSTSGNGGMFRPSPVDRPRRENWAPPRKLVYDYLGKPSINQVSRHWVTFNDRWALSQWGTDEGGGCSTHIRGLPPNRPEY
jgi:hypothetical protein